MTRHYKLSTGSSTAGAAAQGQERTGRSSICERYGRDWVTFGKDGTPSKSMAEKENSFENSFALSPAMHMISPSKACPLTPPFSPVAPPEPATSSAPPATPLSPTSMLKRLPARLSDWTAEHVATWASSTTLCPEVVACLRNNAVNGQVLESLREVDLKTMGLPKLGSWLTLRCQRSELLNSLRGSEITDAAARPRASPGSFTVTVRDPNQPARGIAHPSTVSAVSSTMSSAVSSTVSTAVPRSVSGKLPPRARSPLRVSEVATPVRSGCCTARSVSLTRASPSVQAKTQAATSSVTHSYTPLPQKPAFSPPPSTITSVGLGSSCLGSTSVSLGSVSFRTTIHPPRSSSAIKMRVQDPHLAAAATPRSSSCVRTRRIEYGYPTTTYICGPPHLATVSAVPVVAASPVTCSVSSRIPIQRYDPCMYVTIRPLSPSSGRIRQAPPMRQVRSRDVSEPVDMQRTPSEAAHACEPQATPAASSPLVVEEDRESPHQAEQDEACASPTDPSAALWKRSPGRSEEIHIGEKAEAEDTIFGEAAKSWGKVCSEMAKTSEEDFAKMKSQLNSIFHEKATPAQKSP